MAAPTPSPRRTINRVLPATPVRAAVTMLLLTGVLYLVEILDQASGGALEPNGIAPREADGLDGVLWAPLLHGDWSHLTGNTLPFLVFGFLTMAGGIARFFGVTAIIWLLGGLGVWLTGGEGTVHIGASGVIFGWLTFLLARGFFAGSARQIGFAIVLFGLWGGLLIGVLPGRPDISWQAHLFGALAGLVAARLFAGRRRSRSTRTRSAGPAAP